MINHQLIEFLKTFLPIVFIVLISIIFIRIILRILLHFAYKKYQKVVKKISSKRILKAEKLQPKSDETLSRKKVETQSLIERMPSLQQQEEQEEAELDEVKIVDIAKPVGFWTSMMLGKKLTYLVSSAQIMNQNSRKGFWISMVEAQEKAAGRQKGRSL